MNTIQKALRMLNESREQQVKKPLVEDIVDQDGDVEVTSFNLTDFSGVTEECKSDDCSTEEVNEAASDQNDEYYEKGLIRDILYYVNHDGEYALGVNTKKRAEELLAACKEALKTYIEPKFKDGWLVKWDRGASEPRKREDIELVTDKDGNFVIIADDTDDTNESCEKSCESCEDCDKTEVDEKLIGKGSDISAVLQAAQAKGMKTFTELEDFMQKIGTNKAEEVLAALKDEKLVDEEDPNFSLDESLETSIPVHALPENQVVDAINAIPVAGPGRPPRFFKLGYFKEIKVASKFRGGRGSTADDPMVRIFKATEYNKLYTGSAYENTRATKNFRKETGTERSGERTGFNFGGEGDTLNKIGTYADGSQALQAFIADNCGIKTQYYISLNDGDLTPADRQEVAQYLTPGDAAKLSQPRTHAQTQVADQTTGEVHTEYAAQPINRFKIANIYAIGNLGTYIL